MFLSYAEETRPCDIPHFPHSFTFGLFVGSLRCFSSSAYSLTPKFFSACTNVSPSVISFPYCRVCSEDWFDRQLVWGLNRSNVAVSRVRDRRVCPTQYFIWSDGIVYTISGDRSQLSKVTSNILTWFLVSVVKPITLVDHLRSGRTELVELL